MHHTHKYVFGWFTRNVQLWEHLWVRLPEQYRSTNYLVVIFRYFMHKQRTA